MNRRAMFHPVRLVSSLFLAVSLTACSSNPDTPAQRPPLEGAQIGGAFTLIDKNGDEVRWSDFEGKYRIVYFGYTFCPDACPTDLQLLMQGFSRFEMKHPKLAQQVQPIFISIDPARDTPEAVGQFAAAFHPRLLGLTGTAEQVEQAAKAFVAYYAKGEETAGGYLMDHSRTTYLMGRHGEPIAIIPVQVEPNAKLSHRELREKTLSGIVEDLEKWVK